ncbi:MAG: hypothetical protein LBB72_07750 [Spirochaetaceae bacterium]|nr:hypothetical protein [Spirochaetaceae bacterium]
MEFDEYEEGRGACQSLYDAVGETVRKQYEGIDNYACDSCHKCFMGGRGQCPSCGSWNTHKI